MPRHLRLNNKRSIVVRCRALRDSLTTAEAALWQLLQNRRLDGRKFRRQQSIGPYIVDFYCPRERLVLELDGAAHDSGPAAEKDAVRERFLNATGLTVIRMENREVFENPEGVLQLIRQHFRGV